MTRGRVVLGAVGVGAIGYGVVRLLLDPGQSSPVGLAVWLAVALVVHDSVLVPVVMTVGALLTALVPGRARRPLQWWLVSSAMVGAVTLPLIYRRGSQTASKSLLLQNYAGHLLLVVGLLALVAGLAYARSVLRDGRAAAAGAIPTDR